MKQLPLSSRQRLCINPTVARLGSVQAINDRCAELQQPKSKSKCQFAPGPDNLGPTHQFRDSALATVPDIEDLFDLGKKLAVCPYYASRTAVPGAEVITLPYPLLLQKNARDALGIKLEGNVVIVDEAHNIMDAVANVYASEISLSELRRARQMLGVYVKKFGKKLKGENRVMVAQVARVVDGLSEWMDGAMKTKVGFLLPFNIATPQRLMHHRANKALWTPTLSSSPKAWTRLTSSNSFSTSRSPSLPTRSKATSRIRSKKATRRRHRGLLFPLPSFTHWSRSWCLSPT